MGSRVVLYLRSPAGKDQLDPLVQATGWDIHPATHVAAARTLMDRLTVQAGLFRLDSLPSAETGRFIEFLVATRDRIPWVALVSAGALAQDSIRELIAAFFYDYHTLPADSRHLSWTLGHAVGMANLVDNSEPWPPAELCADDGILGASPAMQAVSRQLIKFASADAPVLITGESGTGKELAARAIHHHSHRASKPMVPVNCGAIPASLIQSELFGYEKGAFTGATSRKVGRIEAANGGTLFLDEIGELSRDLQVNLLRFLQESKIQRLGSPTELLVDVRVIAATNINLEQAIESGAFRHDLYYRLNVFHVHMPSLRERRADILPFARHFFSKFAAEYRSVKGFADDALVAMNE